MKIDVRQSRNAPKLDLRTQLFKMYGVDLTRIDRIDVTPALGAYFMRMCSHMDKPKAVTAAAHKLAHTITKNEFLITMLDFKLQEGVPS